MSGSPSIIDNDKFADNFDILPYDNKIEKPHEREQDFVHVVRSKGKTKPSKLLKKPLFNQDTAIIESFDINLGNGQKPDLLDNLQKPRGDHKTRIFQSLNVTTHATP